MVFGEVIDKDGGPYPADLRAVLKAYANEVYSKDDYTLNAANEIEGFVFKGTDAERRYHETGKFEYVSAGGYYHSLPGDTLRLFIDASAEVQRAMGFQNEKDHPEVAPSQFEINYGYAEVVAAADQIQIYKLICRQIATKMGLTACFLPKPIVGVNGTGMHTNVSITKDGKNLFWAPEGLENMSPFARQRSLSVDECQRQCLPPARPAFRSAEPAQGFGDGPRLDDSHPDRKFPQRASGSSLRCSRCESIHGAVRDLQDRHRG
jgi:glutamine synthetase